MNTTYILYGTIYLSIAIILAVVTHKGYWANPKRRENRYFLILCLGGLIWCLGEAGYWYSEKMEMVLAFYHFKYIGMILTGPSFFLLANAVPIWRNILNKKWVIYFCAGFVLVFEVISQTNPLTYWYFSEYFQVPGLPGKYDSYWTPLGWLYCAIAYSFLIAGFISLLISIKQAKTKIEKSQAKILLIAVIIPFVGNIIVIITGMLPSPSSLSVGISAILFGYAITKYRLMVLTPALETKDGVKELPIRIERGYNYIIEDDHNLSGYSVLRFLSTEKPGLCITGKAPASIRSTFKIEKLPVIWVTDVETSDEQAINPARLDFELTQSVINFMRENPGATVFIDDIEYLSVKCGFEPVSHFLKDVADVAATTSSTLIVQIRPSFFEEEKRKMLTSMFDKPLVPPKMELKNEAAITFLHYRKADSIERIASSIPPGERALVITRTHPKKLEKFFGKAEYYWITDLDITDVKTLRPETVDSDFILAIKNAIASGIRHIVIDGCDVVKIKVNFEKYIGFVKDLTDLAHKHKVKLHCVVELSDVKENVVICNRFDAVFR
ncbi:MAG: DUF835 domain-containing protein [Thermoplasmata archaeon]|nr:DUF835 domain-containing protein [Thermoplasmata archaeon]